MDEEQKEGINPILPLKPNEPDPKPVAGLAGYEGHYSQAAIKRRELARKRGLTVLSGEDRNSDIVSVRDSKGPKNLTAGIKGAQESFDNVVNFRKPPKGNGAA